MDFTRVHQVISEGLDSGIYSAASFAVSVRGEKVEHRSAGSVSFEKNAAKVDDSTLFDIASLTKPVATAASVLSLVELGRLSLVQPVSGALAPAFGDLPNLAGVDFRHLLTHTSGLPPIPRAYSVPDGSSGREIERSQRLAAHRTPTLRDPGLAFTYSDTGYMVLWEAASLVASETLDHYAAREIFAPLGMTATSFKPAGAQIAITDPAQSAGIVHDPRARALGGVTGHAGLFSTASDLLVFAEAIRNGGSPILSKASVSRMRTNQLDPSVGAMSYGWFVNGNDLMPRGDLFSDQAFGHSGFTGCVMVIDPVFELSAVLLTNRVLNTTAEGLPFIKLRRRWLNAVAAAGTR